jgi:hypothetical protein
VNDPPPLLSLLWTASRANGSLSLNSSASMYLLKDLHAQEIGVRTDPKVVQGGRPGPTGPGPSWPGSVAPSILWVLISLCTFPLHLHHFDDVILASKMEVLLA